MGVTRINNRLHDDNGRAGLDKEVGAHQHSAINTNVIVVKAARTDEALVVLRVVWRC